MTWYPIAFLPPQYENASGAPYSGAVLKAYAAGTTNVIPMATSYTGGTAAASLALNASGYPEYNGTVVIPHIQEDYKLVLYPTQAAADLNSGGVWSVDDVKIADSTNTPFVEYFDGDGITSTFTLSEDLGSDEKALMVFADRQLTPLTTNPTFTTDTGWTKGAGWTIAAGVATATGAISTNLSQNASPSLIAGQAYVVQFTITASAGTLTPSIGGMSGTARNSSGTYTEVITAGATQVIAAVAAGFTGTIDNFYVYPAVAAKRQILRTDEYTLVGNQLTLTEVPPPGTKNILVFAPTRLLGAANAAAAAAATSETNAATSAALAADWASKTSAIVAATDYSAKEYARGSQASTGGSAKNWAQQTGADVTGAAANSRSAKSWAQDNLAGATLGGSAKDWAKSTSLPDGTNKSAKSYAYDAADYAADALANANTAAFYATEIGGVNNTITTSGNQPNIIGGFGNEIAGSGNQSIIISGTSNTIDTSGAQPTIVGGNGNTIDGTGAQATIVGGASNEISASGAHNTIVGGAGNAISGTAANATIVGGDSNTASGLYATVQGGLANTASGAYSTASGRAAVASLHGERAHMSDGFAASGDAQERKVILRAATANTTPTELFLDGSAARLSIPNNTRWTFTAIAVAHQTSGGAAGAHYVLHGGVKNLGGTVSLQGAVTVAHSTETDAGLDFAATADNTNDALVFTATGLAATAMRWVVTVIITQVSG